MKIGTRARYAVTAIIDLARHSHGEPVSLSAIAARQGISLNYLEQIFCQLRQHNLITSVRGAAGGYLLGRGASDITMADVMLAMGEPLHATRCMPFSTRGCAPSGARCTTHTLWENLGHRIYGYLNSITLSDMCEDHLGLGKAVLEQQEACHAAN